MSKMFFSTMGIIFLTIIVIVYSCDTPPLTPVSVVTELNTGESQLIKLSNGNIVRLSLLGINEIRDSLRNTIHAAYVKVSVDGKIITLISGNNNLPEIVRPENHYPHAGQEGVSINPTLEYSGTSSGIIASQWQISTEAGFETIIYNKGRDEVRSHVAFAELQGRTQYFWRVRVSDYSSAWSEWSEPTSFTTLDTGNLFVNIFQDGLYRYSGTCDVDLRGSFEDPNPVYEWNQGKQDVLRTGRRGPYQKDEIYRSLLKFDLTALTDSKAVVNAYLTITGWEHTAKEPYVMYQSWTDVFRILRSWKEGTGVAGDAPGQGEASWTFAAYPERWSVPGAAGVPGVNTVADRDSAPLMQFKTISRVGYKMVLSSSNFVRTVQEWIDQPSSNHGILLKATDESFREVMNVASREHKDTSFRPKLVVESLEQSRLK